MYMALYKCHNYYYYYYYYYYFTDCCIHAIISWGREMGTMLSHTLLKLTVFARFRDNMIRSLQVVQCYCEENKNCFSQQRFIPTPLSVVEFVSHMTTRDTRGCFRTVHKGGRSRLSLSFSPNHNIACVIGVNNSIRRQCVLTLLDDNFTP